MRLGVNGSDWTVRLLKGSSGPVLTIRKRYSRTPARIALSDLVALVGEVQQSPLGVFRRAAHLRELDWVNQGG